MRPGSGPYFALISPALRRPDAKNYPSDDVRRGPAGAAPHAGDRQGVVGVDDPRQGIGVGFGPQTPSAGPRQLCMAHAARRSRHALQSQVGGAGENRGEERGRIGVDAPGAQIGKRVEEPREGVHIPQQIGDPDARHQRIDRAVEAFADLLGQPGDQGRGRVGVVEPALARMAQECDVERQPEAVLRAPARPDQIQIIISEQVVALQRRDVGGNPEERFAHRCWHKTS